VVACLLRYGVSRTGTCLAIGRFGSHSMRAAAGGRDASEEGAAVDVDERTRYPDHGVGDDGRALLAAIARDLMAECRARLVAQEPPSAGEGTPDVSWLPPGTNRPAA
jgi:hypothetical protein